MKAHRTYRGINTFFGSLVAWLVLCASARCAEPAQIQGDIDRLLEFQFRANFQERIDQVAKDGTNTVPYLIERYSRTEPEKRWLLVACLCRIPTVESLDFIKTIIRRHEDPRATIEAIRRFPVEQDDQITLLLVDLLGLPPESLNAQERLQAMIFRKASQAGVLVNAMDPSDKSMTGRNWEIGEILAHVSGYSHTWCCFGPSSTDWGAWQHDFWRAWWKRNKDKEPFDWLVETLESDPKNDNRKANALQMLGTLQSQGTPYFVKALDDESERVRYQAVVGLKRLEGTLEPDGYRWETFQREQAQIIQRLKQKFSDQPSPES